MQLLLGIFTAMPGLLSLISDVGYDIPYGNFRTLITNGTSNAVLGP